MSKNNIYLLKSVGSYIDKEGFVYAQNDDNTPYDYPLGKVQIQDVCSEWYSKLNATDSKRVRSIIDAL